MFDIFVRIILYIIFLYTYNIMNNNKYNFLQILDDLSKYDNNTSTCDDILVSLIHNNFNNMTQEEMKYIALKCFSDNDIKKCILQYEFNNYKFTPREMSLEEFQKIAQQIFHKFYWKANGFYFCDVKWTLHTSKSNKYHLYENEILFENNIYEPYINLQDTFDFLRNIISMLKSVATNIVVSIHKKFCPRDKLYFIMIKCSLLKK